MRWRGRRGSTNVEDRRRMSGKRVAAGGGIGAIVIAVAALLIGGDPSALLQVLGGAVQGGGGAPAVGREPTAAEQERFEFTKVVLADTEEVWGDIFRRLGRTYEEPVLVTFTGSTHWAGGTASAAMGPFYAPSDRKVYIDLSFFDELSRRFGASGDFAEAYVIAHEVGHHVQNLLGISDKVHAARNRVSKTEYNRLSVRLELQADFFAGLWAHHADRKFDILEGGDIEEALGAAGAVGDDRIQRQAGRAVAPDSFTHGSSAQRVAWFKHGLRTGDFSEGDTFDEAHFRRIDPGVR